MTKAENFLETMTAIDANLKGIERMKSIRQLITAINIECLELKHKADGSIIYRFDDSSHLRINGTKIEKATAKEYGKPYTGRPGTLKGKQ